MQMLCTAQLRMAGMPAAELYSRSLFHKKLRGNTMRAKVLSALCVWTVVAMAAYGQTFTLVHVFHGADGGDPESAPVLLDKNGNLFSTTAFGGSSGLGTVYKI